MIKFTKEDIKNFTIEVCSECHCKENCESHNLRKEACGKFFNWKIGYTNFVIEYCRDARKNPEKYEEMHKETMRRAKEWKKRQKEESKQKQQ